MPELKDKNTEIKTPPALLPEAEPLAAGQNNANQTQKKAADHTISKGEKWYNWIVYSGLNYWLNLIISLHVIDVCLNRGGRKPIDKASHWLGEKIAATKIASADTAYHHSKTAIETFSTMSGGNLLLIPLKLMEDRKRPIVHWLNKKFGVDQHAPDGHEMTADEIYIEHEQPKQSWARVIGRRALGWVTIVGTGHLINGVFRDRSQPLPARGEKDIYGGKEVVTRKVMNFVNKKVLDHGYIPGSTWLRNNVRAQSWMQFAVLDTIFTKITAVIMHVTNGAKKIKIPQEVNEKPAIETAVPADDLKEALPTSRETLSASRKALLSRENITTHAQRLITEGNQPLLPSH